MIDEVKTNGKSKTESVPSKQTTKSRTMRSEHKRAMKTLETNSQLFKALIHNALDAIVVISPELTIRYESPSMEHLTGRKANSRIGKNPLEFCHPDDIEKVTNEFIKLLESKISRASIEIRLQHKDGRWLAFELVGTNLLDDPVIKGIVLNLRDITQRKQMEEQYRTLVETMNDGLAIRSKDGLPIYVNDRLCEMTGYYRDELIGHSPLELIEDTNRDKFAKEIRRRHKGKNDPYELGIIRKDGSRIIVNVSPQVIYDSEGNMEGSFAVITDITKAREAKEALRKSEQNLKHAQEMAHLGYWEWDTTTNEVIFSEEMQRILGSDKSKVKFSGRPKIIHTDDMLRLEEAVTGAYNGGNPTIEFRLVLPNGDIKWIQAGSTHMETDSAKEGRVFGYALDITERKQSEEALQEAQGKLRTVFDSIGDGVTVLDLAGNIIDVNETVLRIKGYNREDVIGRFGLDFVPERERARATEGMMGLFSGEVERTPFEEYVLLGKDGSEILCEASASLLRDGDGNVVGLISVERDLRERKKAKQQLQESEERLRAFMEAATDSFALWDSELNLVEMNNAGIASFPPGTKKAKVIGKNLREMVSTGRIEKYLEVMKTGNPLIIEDAISSPEFGSKHMDMRAFKVGEGLGIIVRDVTERRHTEEKIRHYSDSLRAMAKRLSEVEESLRHRTARELHDNVGQNLTALGINLNRIKAKLEKAGMEEEQNILKDSQLLIEQTTESIRDVMASLRPPVLEDYGILATLKWYGQRFNSRTGIAITVDGEEPDPRMSADTEIVLFRIYQEALTNISKHAKASIVTVNFYTKDGRHRLSITDNGSGFDSNELANNNEQANWGLVTMAERADSISASFEIDSTPGRGTQVIVEI